MSFYAPSYVTIRLRRITRPPHPIHRHGTKAHIIGYGQGDFPWPNVATARKAIPNAFNLENPPLRDGFYTPVVITTASWLAVRYHVHNPGVSPPACTSPPFQPQLTFHSSAFLITLSY